MPDLLEDERGFFARSWCEEAFREQGLDGQVSQCNISYNKKAGTLRGMHYQVEPHAERKLVRCTQGAILDVIVDLRRESVSYCQWYGVELTAQNRQSLYIPKGFAHGFLTLTDGAEVFYQMFDPFVPGTGAGVRWDDPAFGIQWPNEPSVLSERDAAYPDFVK